MAETSDFSRRDFQRGALATVLTTSLLEMLLGGDLLAAGIKPITEKWLRDVNELCADVKGQKVKQVDWQAKLEELFKRAEMSEILAAVDFDRVTKGIKFQEQGERSVGVEFPKVEGMPPLAYGKQIFALQKGHAIVPHGHNNMATAFLILQGDFQGRHYDRVEDTKTHMIIKPTIDRKFTVGEASTISDDKDNVHWYTALSDTAFIFNIHVDNIVPGSKKTTGRVYIDPNGEKIEGGLIRAPLLKAAAAYKLYG